MSLSDLFIQSLIITFTPLPYIDSIFVLNYKHSAAVESIILRFEQFLRNMLSNNLAWTLLLIATHSKALWSEWLLFIW
jgi:hypothetical protein